MQLFYSNVEISRKTVRAAKLAFPLDPCVLRGQHHPWTRACCEGSISPRPTYTARPAFPLDVTHPSRCKTASDAKQGNQRTRNHPQTRTHISKTQMLNNFARNKWHMCSSSCTQDQFSYNTVKQNYNTAVIPPYYSYNRCKTASDAKQRNQRTRNNPQTHTHTHTFQTHMQNNFARNKWHVCSSS